MKIVDPQPFTSPTALYFETSVPAIGDTFYNRRRELAELEALSQKLGHGSVEWLALLGHRKTGKTSLLLEWQRRLPKNIFSPFINCWGLRMDPHDLLEHWIEATLAAFLKAAAPAYLGALAAASPVEKLAGLTPLKLGAITQAIQLLDALDKGALSRTQCEAILDLPDRLAQESGRACLFIIDEFQELEKLREFKQSAPYFSDPYALLRRQWMTHRHTSYIASGSHLHLMRQLLTHSSQPFFQHFRLMDLGPFDRPAAADMIVDILRHRGLAMDEKALDFLFSLLGTHPFYLQVFGQELVRQDAIKTVDQKAIQYTLQETLLTPNGRLSLYFEDLFSKAVGRSSLLEGILYRLDKPKRITDLAQELRVERGAVSSGLKTLLERDIVTKRDEGDYTVIDPCFRIWLQDRATAFHGLPPLYIGTEAEKQVARALAAQGLGALYQARASRGAFDLIAFFRDSIIGIQVKKTSLPYSLRALERDKLLAEAKRLKWIAVLALVVDNRVLFYDIKKLRKTKTAYGVQMESPAKIGSLFEIL